MRVEPQTEGVRSRPSLPGLDAQGLGDANRRCYRAPPFQPNPPEPRSPKRRTQFEKTALDCRRSSRRHREGPRTNRSVFRCRRRSCLRVGCDDRDCRSSASGHVAADYDTRAGADNDGHFHADAGRSAGAVARSRPGSVDAPSADAERADCDLPCGDSIRTDSRLPTTRDADGRVNRTNNSILERPAGAAGDSRG